MTQIMTPSKTTTAGQIDKAVANYRALLEKYSGEFNADAVQTVLGQPELAGEQLAIFRRRVEAISSFVVRRGKVNRNRTPQEALDATDRTQYTDRRVVDAMPKGEDDEVEVVFFKLGRFINDDDLEGEFELRGLKPADPISVAAVNEVDSTFADEHPNSTHWKNADGQWCYAAFIRWHDAREVHVDRIGLDWSDHWFFAGLRK